MKTIRIKPEEVTIGMTITVDPNITNSQENAYYWFRDNTFTVEEIITLPNGCFYFIYGGFDRNSSYIEKDTIIEIKWSEILKHL